MISKHINSVELTGHFGSDETHALSAWTSTSRSLSPEKRKRIPKMLRDLMVDGHHTPFEKSYLQFLVNVETASHIHFLKHRIGVSINGESARYKELTEDKYYLPFDWPEKERVSLSQHFDLCFSNYHACLSRLVEAGMGRKRAKETARFYLPYGSQVMLDVSFNWRSFIHFQTLRNSKHAQAEIRNIADAMLTLVANIEGDPFKETLEVFSFVTGIKVKPLSEIEGLAVHV